MYTTTSQHMIWHDMTWYDITSHHITRQNKTTQQYSIISYLTTYSCQPIIRLSFRLFWHLFSFLHLLHFPISLTVHLLSIFPISHCTINSRSLFVSELLLFISSPVGWCETCYHEPLWASPFLCSPLCGQPLSPSGDLTWHDMTWNPCLRSHINYAPLTSSFIYPQPPLLPTFTYSKCYALKKTPYDPNLPHILYTYI